MSRRRLSCGCFAPLVILAVCLIAALLLHNQLLTALGGYLVVEESPQKADLAVVLAGDQMGNRVLKAGELVRQGWVPYALVSGTPLLLENEAELNIAYAVSKGYPKDYFRPFERDMDSTRQETGDIAALLQREGVHSILLVTSNYHTRRAKSLMQKAAPFLKVRVMAAPDRFFSPGGWWKTRSGQRLFLYEWLKTFSAWLGN